MTTASGPHANDLFTALAHPLRRRILREMLADESEISPRELALALDQSLARLSYHVRVLAQCEALELVRTRQIRGSTQHFYVPSVDASWARQALETDEDASADSR
jgi:DNA-binding transcriptional ArsR family regulator